MAVYTTADKVRNLMSEDGLLYRIDDDEDFVQEYDDSSNPRLDFVIEEASREVDFYLAERYDPSTSAYQTNGFVVHATTILSACIVAGRRGNGVPTSYADRCTKWTTMLQAIKDGEATVPDLPLRDVFGVLVSGMTVDMRYRNHPIRRDPIRSTGDPPGDGVTTHNTRYPRYDW